LPRDGLFYSLKMNTSNLNDFNEKFTIARNRTLETFSNLSNISRFNLSKNNFDFLRNIRRNHLVYAAAVILLIITFLIGRSFGNDSSPFPADDRTEAPKPIATQVLNREFKFPLKDDSGKEVAKISYFLQLASIQDAFIYQGKLAKAVKGRTFLIFDIKITNPYTKSIEINSRDYIRIKVNNASEQLAPEIHNDPIQIQANSTKYARIGLPVNDSDKNIILLIGELQGKKQTVKLNLKR